MSFIMFSDLFEVTCKKCKSDDVWIYVDECLECGNTINGECNSCGSKFDYHDFKEKK